MKTILIAFSILFSLQYAHAQWEPLTNTNTDQPLVGVFFLDTDYGISVGQGGIVTRTEDGGDTWTSQSLGSYNFIRCFLVDSVGFIVGDEGNVFKSLDYGRTWQSIVDFDLRIKAVHFFDTQVGVIAGDRGLLYKTTDGGANWTNITPGNISMFRDLFFIDQQNGYACGDSGSLYRTSDGGDTWFRLNINHQGILWAMYFFDAQNGYICGDNSSLYKTSNGGLTWEESELTDTPLKFRGIYFLDDNNGYVIGDVGLVLKTEDGGLSWQSESTSTTKNLFDISVIDENNAFACSMDGLIIRLRRPTNTNDIDTSPTGVKVFPNPSAGWFVIEGLDPQSLITAFQVFDAAGKLIHQERGLNTNRVEINNHQWPKGIYTIQLLDHNNRQHTTNLIIQ
ncbi:MAG: YCF48-related protein [Bacteroidota bacterium]